MKIMRSIVTAALVLLPVLSYGADTKGAFAIKGAGVVDCQRYLAAREKKDQEFLLFVGYISGYMTSYNQYSPTTFDVVPWQSTESLTVLLANYCRQNTKQNFAIAVSQLAKALEADRLKESSNLVDVKRDKINMKIYQATLQRVQQQLVKLGYKLGKADGNFSPETQSALEQYQKAKGLKQTGVPDQATLFTLLFAK